MAAMTADFHKMMTPTKLAAKESNADETFRTLFNAKLRLAITAAMTVLDMEEENKTWRRNADGKLGFFMEYSSTTRQYWRLQVVMHIHANGKLVNACRAQLLTASASAPVTRSETQPLALIIFNEEKPADLGQEI